MTAMTLFEIAVEHRQLCEKLADLNLDEQTLADTLSGESWPLEVKAQNCMYVIKNSEALEAAIETRISELKSRLESIQKRRDGLQKYVLTCMQVAQVKKISCPDFEISVRDNPVSVDVFQPEMIPDLYMRTPEPRTPVAAPDKGLIKKAIEDGFDVPGAKLVQAQRLVVK